MRDARTVTEIDWRVTEREWSTFFEAEVDGFTVWLEWNPRVFAYRFGFVTPEGARVPNTLGYAADEDEAKTLLVAALERLKRTG